MPRASTRQENAMPELTATDTRLLRDLAVTYRRLVILVGLQHPCGPSASRRRAQQRLARRCGDCHRENRSVTRSSSCRSRVGRRPSFSWLLGRAAPRGQRTRRVGCRNVRACSQHSGSALAKWKGASRMQTSRCAGWLSGAPQAGHRQPGAQDPVWKGSIDAPDEVRDGKVPRPSQVIHGCSTDKPGLATEAERPCDAGWLAAF